MLQFEAYCNGKAASEVDLDGAYVFGQDDIPIRADLAASGNMITCSKRVPGASGLALMWKAEPAGQYLLQTTRLPDRDRPYHLNIELARAQLMRLIQKREDWGLFDYAEAKPLNVELEAVCRQFIEALKLGDPAQAAIVADQALAASLTLGEKLALFHADAFISRRKAAAPAAMRIGFGCLADLATVAEGYQEAMRESFDFVSVPVPWKHLEPKEGQHHFAEIDTWLNWAARSRKLVHMGPLLSFEPAQLPDWLYIWEHDYEALRDLIYEHVQRIVKRYERHVRVWNVVSGLHAHNNFNLSFEQIMELTRMCCLLVKKLSPKAQVMIELTTPWGEYYARNQRTIPPLLYADMAVQSGIKFDAFGLQLLLGVPADGYFLRDLMQISSLLDEFVSLSKGLHITACQVPSEATPDPADAWSGQLSPARAGFWHAPWSQRLQAEWLQAFYRIAMSKPFVETLCWRDLADEASHCIPHGGLCTTVKEPKLSYKELRNFRASLLTGTVAATDVQRRGANSHPANR